MNNIIIEKSGTHWEIEFCDRLSSFFRPNINIHRYSDCSESLCKEIYNYLILNNNKSF